MKVRQKWANTVTPLGLRRSGTASAGKDLRDGMTDRCSAAFGPFPVSMRGLVAA
ncbi:hypothetical protein BJY18_005936 [Amycolatopsis jiangsuensis]|uniref:Uncharacterized protein n=1 Tax=Amycolatopsis jiangsuensis TaxID=1181879 RepID=A0A840J015_9PSEU|nr:hypothetical protein [Amycolatopsis jiangsuensis]